MLAIRPEQMKVFEEQARATFIGWAAGHLRSWFEPELAGLDDDALRELVEHGMERAVAWGATSHEAIGLYLNVMALFGRDFDVDPCRWAALILRDTSIDDPNERIRLLAATAVERLPGD
jgi:hypothetical protein